MLRNFPLSLPANAVLTARSLGTVGIRCGLPLMIAVFGWGAFGFRSVDAAELSFQRDVMAVLSQAGCNAGACHGNLNGKGGFKLSLRGQDPRQDWEWLARESGGRRINRSQPEESLILLKATGRISHQGGTRFSADSLAYRVLRDWITDGASFDGATLPVALEVSPSSQVLVGEAAVETQLQVWAQFSDGQRRDVTSLATFELSDLNVEVTATGLVRRVAFGESTIIVRYLNQQVPVRVAFIPERGEVTEAAPPANNFIDSIVDDRLRALQIVPSPTVSDSTFVRRVYLDAIGLLPTADEAREFAQDTRPDKRERLIDALLARPEFADLWGLRWSDVLRAEEKVLDERGVEVFHGWIRRSMSDGKPLDRFVRELLRATGSTYEEAPANFWRANRDPETRAETVARLFLGVRLQCARCHNHPFDRWTQDDYYAWSAVFARIDYEILKNERRDKLDKNEFNGEQIVKIADGGGVTHPQTGRRVSAKLLGAKVLEPSSYHDRLTPAAVWITSPDNGMFARTMANFIWYHLLGRGLVDPIDDLRATNPAVHEPLLDALADYLVAERFDLRRVVRVILRSRTYQLSAIPNVTNQDDASGLSRAVVSRLPAEKLLDAQSQLLDWPADFAGQPRGTRAGQLPGGQRGSGRGRSSGGGDQFLKMFGKPERLLACECERSNETSLNQAFVLIGSEELHKRIVAAHNRLDQLARSELPPEQLVEELYWWSLARPPVSEELAAAVRLFANEATEKGTTEKGTSEKTGHERDVIADRRAALEDLAWALMNAKEFLFRW